MNDNDFSKEKRKEIEHIIGSQSDSQIKNEITYLSSLIVDVEKEVGNLSFKYGIAGVAGPLGDGLLGNYFSCKMLIESLISLNKKIIYSFEEGLKYVYSKSVLDNFRSHELGGQDEFLSFYYLENIIYRTSIIWDYTAQLYNIFYRLNKDVDKINYKNFFNELGQSKKFKKNKDVISINNYFKETDDTFVENGKWKGNHNYIKELRNEMTHRSSFDVAALSPLAIKLKPSPIFVLKRTLEDYNTGVNFFKMIALEIMNNKDDDKLLRDMFSNLLK